MDTEFKIHREQEPNLKIAFEIALEEEPTSFPIDDSLLMVWNEHEGDREYAYTTAIMPGYSGVRFTNPEQAEAAWELFDNKNRGQMGLETMAKYIDKGSSTLLLPLQAGRCTYNCLGCDFAFDTPANRSKKTKNLNPEEIKTLIIESLKMAKKKGIDTKSLGLAFVGSGDATPNHHLKKILEMILKDFPEVISRIRISTVAGKSQITTMQTLSEIYLDPKYQGKPILSIQVSAHSTDENIRARHVEHQSTQMYTQEGDFNFEAAKKRLMPLEEVVEEFKKIIESQKTAVHQGRLTSVRKPSLTFVCTAHTELNVNSLLFYGFKPEETIIQLRPMFFDDERDLSTNMKRDKFIEIYKDLIKAKFEVVVMPVSPSGVELKAA
jgi:hypothetical protein